ncbi:MAG: histidine phosphatase family protein [Candidatus Dormibacteria bacterium]
MKTLLYIARHGTTTDSNKGIIRGTRNALLDKKGFQDAHVLKDFFKKKEWRGLYTSKLARSLQTARIISDGQRDDEIHHSIANLEPWRVGYLTGKDKKIYGPDMTVFIENPDMTPQDGESQNHFHDRVDPLLIEAMEMGIKGKPPIIIGHSSVIHALAHLLWGEGHPPLAVKPGGVIEVFVNKKGEINAQEIFKPGKDDSSFAGGNQPTS